MTIVVSGPDGSKFQFPDGTAQETITSALNQHYAVGKPPAAVDAAKSLGVGIAEAGVGLAGLPGDIGSLVSMGLGKLGVPEDARKAGASVVKAIPGLSAFTGPGSGDVRKTIEDYTGEFYKPQTTLGEYAKTFGEFSAGAALPGGLARRALNVALPAVSSESAGQITKGSAAEPWARAGGALAGGIAAARGITPAPSTAERAALAGVLEREGVPLTAGQRTGSRPLQWFEQAAADTPIAASRAAQINENQGRAFTGAVMRRMGASGDEIATPDAVNRAVTNLGQRFDDISARNTLTADQRFANDLIGVARQYGRMVSDSRQAPVVREMLVDIGNLVQRTGGQIPGDVYQSYRSRLDKMGRGVSQSDPQLSEALLGARRALDDAMSRSISPADRAEWGQLRTQWKNWKAIEKATSGAGSQVAEGFISPSQLRSAVAGQNRGAYARGHGDMADLARAGEALLRPLPQSGTAPRQAASNMFASLGGMFAGNAAGGPFGAILGALAPALAGRAMLSPPVQNWLANQAMPVTREQMRQLLLLQQAPTLPRPQ